MGDPGAMMQLLRDGVPVTLLFDLAQPPDAEQVYEVEGGAADWLTYPSAPTPES